MNKNELTRSILEEIGYGTLSAAETERRLNGLIDRELTRPLSAPVNAELIDLCSTLILRLHGAELVTKSASAMADAVLDRLRHEKKKTSVRRWLRPLAVAAALVLVAAVSLGLIHFHWFTGHSSKSQTQFIIEGHEIKTGKTAEAVSNVEEDEPRRFICASSDNLTVYLGFDPHLPQDVGGTWLPIGYDATIALQKVDAACTYAPEGDLSSRAQIIRYNVCVYSDPALVPAFESLGEGGYVQLAGTQVYRYIAADPGHIAWSWRRGNALLTLDAPVTAALPESAVETLIRTQARVILDEPPIFAAARSTPEPLQRQPRVNARMLRKLFQRAQGTERYISNTSLDLENLFGFSFGDLDVLPEKWHFDKAESRYNEDMIKVTVDYSDNSDSDRTFRLMIDVTADPDTPESGSMSEDGTVEKMHGTDVRISSSGSRCTFAWSVGQVIYRVTSMLPPEEVTPAVRALVAGTMPEATAAPEVTPMPSSSTAAEEPWLDPADEDGPAEDEVYLITEETLRQSMEEQKTAGRIRVTPEMVSNALERTENIALRSEDLSVLSKQLGFPLDPLFLESFGWTIKHGEAVPFNETIMVGVIYSRINEPQTEMSLHIDFRTGISELYLSLEQDREGVWKTINDIRVYTYTNCGRNGCFWAEGMNTFIISSDQPASALERIVDHLTRAVPLAEAPDEMQVHQITAADLQQASEKRAAAGLPDSRGLTSGTVRSIIEQHFTPRNWSTSSDYLTGAAMQLGCFLDHLSIEGIGWEASFIRTVFQHDSIMFVIHYQCLSDLYRYARLVIFSYADAAEAHASVEEDKEGTHRTVNGYDIYTYTNHSRPGCVWYDGCNIYLLTVDQPEDAARISEELARQL